jgi:hypothetical protein
MQYDQSLCAVAQQLNKKFWEELIRLLSYVSHLFQVREPNLVELKVNLI